MSNFGQGAKKYWAKGLHVLPVKPNSKQPIFKAWTKYLGRKPTDNALAEWVKNHPASGLALLLGTPVDSSYKLIAIDCDDDRLVRFTKAILGNGISGKIGKKGATFFARYSAQTPIRSTSIKGPQGFSGFDILAEKKCTIIPESIHPDTGEAYKWLGTPLLDINLVELPVFTQHQLALMKTVMAAVETAAIISGTATNEPTLILVAKLVQVGAHDDEIVSIIKALLPVNYLGNTMDELPIMISGAREKGYDKPASGSEKQSLSALRLFKALDVEFFHTQFNEPYAHIKHQEGAKVSYPVSSSIVKGLIQHMYFKEEGKPLSTIGLNEVISALEAEAQFNGSQQIPHVRLAEHEDAIYIDLGRLDGQSVKIDSSGWKVVTKTPIKFRRPSGFKELPLPQKSNGYSDMHRLLGLSGQNSTLRLAFEINCLNPKGSYMALLTQGQQGSGKTFHNLTIKEIIDPSEAPKLRLPKREQDLAIQAKDNFLISYDNASRLKWEMSDLLCTVATGGGIMPRKLYSDDEAKIFTFCRPVMLNGIGEYADRPDFLERAIQINLQSMKAGVRKSERQLKKDFEKLLPGYLGFLYECVACALVKIDEVVPPTELRMADAAHWLVAAEPATGLPEGSFVNAIRNVQNDMYIERVINNPICVELFRLLKDKNEYEGTVGDLHQNLERRDDARVSGLPRSPAALSNALKRIDPMLRKIGIFHDFLGCSREGMLIRVWYDETKSDFDLGFTPSKDTPF
ncbi:bifunctional DNA primase/polymerase [Litorimonas sp. RW-G-Af-16]|uniref:bifunctional DNA primase/polymerase n=1 Tax=Litorimonas sp. RW-G-Af-16 TaxID=3241168 RepID=UPI00390CB51B